MSQRPTMTGGLGLNVPARLPSGEIAMEFFVLVMFGMIAGLIVAVIRDSLE